MREGVLGTFAVSKTCMQNQADDPHCNSVHTWHCWWSATNWRNPLQRPDASCMGWESHRLYPLQIILDKIEL